MRGDWRAEVMYRSMSLQSQNASAPASLQSLPDELLRTIDGKLDRKSLIAMANTDRAWRNDTRARRGALRRWKTLDSIVQFTNQWAGMDSIVQFTNQWAGLPGLNVRELTAENARGLTRLSARLHGTKGLPKKMLALRRAIKYGVLPNLSTIALPYYCSCLTFCV